MSIYLNHCLLLVIILYSYSRLRTYSCHQFYEWENLRARVCIIDGATNRGDIEVKWGGGGDVVFCKRIRVICTTRGEVEVLEFLLDDEIV